MTDLLHRAGPGPLVVKIDIEGYEYEIMDELKRLDSDDVKGIQLAVHPALYEKSLGGPFLIRRCKTLLATLRLARLYRRLERAAPVGMFPGLAAYLVQGVALRPSPKGADVLFLNPRSPLQSGGANHTLTLR
jgi:hypothetical protein